MHLTFILNKVTNNFNFIKQTLSLMNKLITTLLILLISTPTFADCVYDAQYKTSYKVIEETACGAKIYFYGGGSTNFIVEVCGLIDTNYIEQLYFLKDNFCDYESEVIFIDGVSCDITAVTEVE